MAYCPPSEWIACPGADLFHYERRSVRRYWRRLHAGDRLAPPTSNTLLDGWVAFHNGEFGRAFAIGCAEGHAGDTLANRAGCAYANYLETDPDKRLDLFLDVAARAAAHAERSPGDANAHFLYAFALGRYSQHISVTRALALGFGSDVKRALETALAHQPAHVESHIALGAFHAEIIDKVGPLIGNLTYGAKRETSLERFAHGLQLQPRSALGLTEYAQALLMLDGDTRRAEARQLFAQAAGLEPVDALDFLAITVAQAGLPEAI